MKSRKARKAKKGGKVRFQAWRYRRAKFRSPEGFIEYIENLENGRGNRIDSDEAREKFVTLRILSAKADAEFRVKDIYIVCDEETGEWGGYGTAQRIAGIKSRIKPGSYQAKFGELDPMLKIDVLKKIMSIEKCDMERAKVIFESCRRSGILVPIKPTGFWRGVNCMKEPTKADIAKRPLTEKQAFYLSRYGDMPPVTHSYGEGEKSEHLAWMMERHIELGEPIALAEADRLRMRAWDCGKSPWKQENG